MLSRKKWLLFAALLCLLALYLFCNAGTYLVAPARSPIASDAIIILGGDGGARTIQGIELYRKGIAPRIVLTGLDDGEADIQKYYLNWRSQALIDGGVSRDRIEFDLKSRNSWEESTNTLQLAKAKGWHKVIVVSDPPHMRRLHWVWSKTFKESGVEVILVAGTPKWWTADRWWSNEPSAKFVVNEYVKIAYYLIKY